MNILLLGMMGSGKTTVGKLLAEKLGFKFLRMDELILGRTGFTSAAEVYEYRMSLWKETEIALSKDLSTRDNQVISCTASVLDNELNIIYFEENNKNLKSVYLRSTPKTLLERILKKTPDALEKTDSQKNTLLGSIDEIFKKRDAYFKQYADIIVDTDKLEVKDVSSKILVSF